MTASMESLHSRLKTWPIAAVLEFQKFTGHGVAQAVDAGDAVTHFDDGSDFVDRQAVFETGDFFFEDIGDFGDVNSHWTNPLFSVNHLDT